MPPTPTAAPAPEEEALERVEQKADAAMAQALAIAQEAGELLAALGDRISLLERRPAGGQDGSLEERVAILEQNVTLPMKHEPIVARNLCDDCGAPDGGPHFDDCRYLANPMPKGPRSFQQIAAAGDRA